MFSCTKCGKEIQEEEDLYFIVAQKKSYNFFQEAMNRKRLCLLCNNCHLLPLDIDTTDKKIEEKRITPKELRYFLESKGGETNE
jgi:transcription initiation factor IIE alpha subunit